jgi:HAD superfamily hydrolase (TIGR01549 family)
MSKVLLFDLDGTLLPMDTEQFVEGYLKALAGKVASHIEPDLFVKALWKGTHAMILNTDPTKSNEQVFEEEFLTLTQLQKEDIWPVFDEFYLNTFPTLSNLSKSTPLAKLIVEEALSQGYRVGIATNPVFPRLAIEHRIKWAGVDHIPFDIVTVYEESNYTKPHKEYYEMICDKLEVQPEECIMVGNDIQEDMSAKQLGMNTYLVEGYVIDRGEPTYQVDARGTLEQLYEQLKNREGIFSL